MSFLRSMTNALSETVSDLVKKATSGGNPYEVQDFSTNTLSRHSPICTEDCVTLYKEGGSFFCVVYYPAACGKAFSLFRIGQEHEAMTTFSNMSYKLQPLYLSSKKILCKEMLQRFSDALRSNRTWTSAHIAAHLGLTECFRHGLVSQQLEAMDDTTQVTPIQVAIEAGHLESIQELIIMGVRLNLADSKGNNVFHYAAKCTDSTVTQYLASKDQASINQLNLAGESPLHIACDHDKPDNVEQLLRWGADANLDMSGRYPIHCATKVSSAKCIEVLCKWSRDQLHVQDKKYGGTPLHWAKSRKCIYTLADRGCNLEAKSNAGETALHIMIQRNRQECVMGLLTKGADALAVGANGASTLEMATNVDNARMVQALIVFGADVNRQNAGRQSPRHLAAGSRGKNRDQILYLLHRVGAQRCPSGMAGCNVGCNHGGNYDGLPKGKVVTTPEHQKQFYDTMVADVAMAAALTRSTSASGSAIMSGDALDTGSPVGSAGDRVLCLDGGGIRGLVLIQVLLAVEKVVGQPIRNCFDWIGGTSTGGILALAIVHGKSMRYAQGLYFRLKDEVFVGKRPYDSEPLESFMKKEFGETTRMSEKEYPRVLVTGVLGDRVPSELHMFRNYDPPGEDQFLMMNPKDSPFPAPPRPNEQLVWRAARCSGAAPTYFRAFGRFLDGGLMANNPTLDVLTEVHKYHMGLRVTRKTEMIRQIHVVLSLGTGRVPPKPVNAVDVYRPEGLFDVARVAFGAKNLGEMLVEQCTQSEGRPVERARAWCSMIGVPYFRLSPQMSEDVPLDCRDDDVLINMLWETQCYIWDNQEKIAQLCSLLGP